MLTWNASVGHSFAATQHPDKHIRSGFLWLQVKVAYSHGDCTIASPVLLNIETDVKAQLCECFQCSKKGQDP